MKNFYQFMSIHFNFTLICFNLYLTFFFTQSSQSKSFAELVEKAKH